MKKIFMAFILSVVMAGGFLLNAFAEDRIIIGIENGQCYENSDLQSVSIDINDEFDLIKVTVDYELFTSMEAGGTVDLSSLSVGRHFLSAEYYKNDVLCGEKTVCFSVAKSEIVSIFDDLENYESTGSKLPDGFKGSFGASRGTATIINAEDEQVYGGNHGVVALIEAVGSEKTDNKIPENGAYWNMDKTEDYSKFAVSFDVFITEVPASYDFRLRYISGSAKLKTIATVTGDKIKGINADDCSAYDKNSWYNFKFTVDLIKDTVALTVTKIGDETPIIDTPARKLNINTGQASLRMIMSVTNPGQTAKIAFDNFLIEGAVSPLLVSSIGYDNNASADIPPESDRVTITFNSMLNAEIAANGSIKNDMVKVYVKESNREVIIDSIECADSKITVIFREKLIPSTLYLVKLNKIEDINGIKITENTRDWFSTTPAQLDVVSLKRIESENKIAISGTMVDMQNSGKPLMCVLSVWNGEKLVDITYKSITAGEFTTNYVNFTAGNTLQFFVFEPDSYKVLIKQI